MLSSTLRRLCAQSQRLVFGRLLPVQVQQKAQENTSAVTLEPSTSRKSRYESIHGFDIPGRNSLGLGSTDEGEVLFPPDVPEVTDIEESTEEWKYVEALLPTPLVPSPPEHAHYPTASGWVPPTATSSTWPYYLRRSRFHNLPIYLEVLNGGNRRMTLIKKVEGDLWAFEHDLRTYLESRSDKRVYTQVDEVCMKLRVRGVHLEDVAAFALEKGF